MKNHNCKRMIGLGITIIRTNNVFCLKDVALSDFNLEISYCPLCGLKLGSEKPSEFAVRRYPEGSEQPKKIKVKR